MKLIRKFPLLWVCALLLLCGCGGGTQVKADLSSYGDTPITISGLTEEEFTVTPNQLKQLKCIKQNVTGSSAKAGSVSAVGPTLDTFLAQYGKQKSDFARIRFIASDAYQIGFLPEALEQYEFILAVANGDQPLNENQLPLWLVVPGADSAKWVRMVVRIEFVLK